MGSIKTVYCISYVARETYENIDDAMVELVGVAKGQIDRASKEQIQRGFLIKVTCKRYSAPMRFIRIFSPTAMLSFDWFENNHMKIIDGTAMIRWEMPSNDPRYGYV